MKAAKIWQALLEGSRNVRFDDLIRLAEAFGFELKRVTGSHHILAHPAMAELLNLELVCLRSSLANSGPFPDGPTSSKAAYRKFLSQSLASPKYTHSSSLLVVA